MKSAHFLAEAEEQYHASSWMFSHVNVKGIQDVLEDVCSSISCYSTVAELYI
jgi:hypothetical protein